MLTPTRGISPVPVFPPSLNGTTFSKSSTSFAQQLAESLQGYLGESSAGARLEIDILPTQGPNVGTRQFVVTVKEPDARPVAAATAAQAPLTALSAAEEAEPRSGNLVDAYWASQPKEVRALRDIGDPEQRGLEAAKLSRQGFVIDYSIMILGWNPYNTMKARMQEGYTWTPAYGQSAIPVGPGLSFPGFATYDPARPPAGSVPVSLDFAQGLEHLLGNPGSSNAADS